MTSPTLITEHLAEAFLSDPHRALVGVRELHVSDVPWLERRAVLLARRDGRSWSSIGRLLQRSRQAVRQRYLADDGLPAPLPHRPRCDDELIIGRWNASLADLRRRHEFDARDDVVPW